MAALALCAGAQQVIADTRAQVPDRAVAPTALVDQEPNCAHVLPERTPEPLSDAKEVLPLAITVLVAQPDLAGARERLRITKDIFGSAGVDLRVSFRLASTKVPTFAGSTGEKHRAAIAFAKSQFGGARPKGTDLVLFLNHQLDTSGFADCIGGIADPTRSFAVAGLHAREDGPSNDTDDGTVAAHELGHLLGAQHHYGNCAEAQPSAFLQKDQDLNPCTLMFQTSITPMVGTLEATYIRDYVRAYGQHVPGP